MCAAQHEEAPFLDQKEEKKSGEMNVLYATYGTAYLSICL